jgi:folate-binding protein YgfZ
VYGITGPDAEAAARTRVHMAMDATGLRQMIVAPRGEPAPEGEAADRDSWRLDDVAAGIPEVVTATSGAFVGQMLNLDVLDGISFNKGCYTGQEVIARAHFRGQVKRRMQRFATLSWQPLAAGERVRLADGRSAQVVTAAPSPGGGWEFLAVTTLPGKAEGVEAETAPAEADAAAPDAVPLPLPYLLPG